MEGVASEDSYLQTLRAGLSRVSLIAFRAGCLPTVGRMSDSKGMGSGAVRVLEDVMAIYKRATAVMRNEMPSSTYMLHLLVQETRLSSFIRIFKHIVQECRDDAANPLKGRVGQEVVQGVSEAMLKTQVDMTDRTSWKLVGKIKTQTNMESMGFLIEVLTQLNDNLSDLMSTEKLKDLSTSLIEQLWSCSSEGLSVLRDSGWGSPGLRRTLDKAYVRLIVWRDDFDFRIPQIEFVSRSNEDLYIAVADVFGRLVCMLSRHIMAKDDGLEPAKLHRNTCCLSAKAWLRNSTGPFGTHWSSARTYRIFQLGS